MAKKFEIYDAHPREVVKALQGREANSQWASLKFYLAPNGLPKLSAIIKYEDSGYWTAPRSINVREWTLDEYKNGYEEFFDYESNMQAGIQRNNPTDTFFFLDPKKGVSAITVYDEWTQTEWDNVQLTIDGGFGGTATISGMENWPEEGPYDLGIAIEGNHTSVKGTKSEILAASPINLADEVPAPGEYVFFAASIEGPAVRAYFDWSYWGDGYPQSFPLVIEPDQSVGGVQELVRFYIPQPDDGGGL